ncbi:DUF6428 family protein [Algoriphagus halophilus]|uniref:Uncharacterized protein n=1 Tax=Algoriphagus halophilus TaxID=226505 RepID=A0A1N6DJP4_9BACT|nr:DUF6428 family protein [Algoriphagus halophilus]SIN71051.1 hypothetical protein SAMN05444394_1024 [Algoriphagus halophilus]
MKLSELITELKGLEELRFVLPNGELIPSHFHVTEIGQINKKFIDCGGKIREEKSVSFQLWEDGDFNHRLGAKKLLHIIDLSIQALGLEDHGIEVEYQGDTIGKYGIQVMDGNIYLTSKQTTCLAKETCGAPNSSTELSINEIEAAISCSPEGSCC